MKTLLGHKMEMPPCEARRPKEEIRDRLARLHSRSRHVPPRQGTTAVMMTLCREAAYLNHQLQPTRSGGASPAHTGG